MSTVPAAAQYAPQQQSAPVQLPPQPASPRRPALETALENLGEVQRQLTETSVAFQRVRDLLRSAQSPGFDPAAAGLSLQLNVVGVPVAVPTPSDVSTYLSYIEDAAAELGESVVALWQRAHAITSSAVQTCAAAQAAQAAPQQ